MDWSYHYLSLVWIGIILQKIHRHTKMYNYFGKKGYSVKHSLLLFLSYFILTVHIIFPILILEEIMFQLHVSMEPYLRHNWLHAHRLDIISCRRNVGEFCHLYGSAWNRVLRKIYVYCLDNHIRIKTPHLSYIAKNHTAVMI